VPTTRSIPRPASSPSDVDLANLHEAAAYYRRTLLETRPALDYVERRGLTPEIVERFNLGYSNRTIARILPSRGSNADIEKRHQLSRVGLLSHNGFETFAGSLVFPIEDEEGRVVGMYGRRINPPPNRISVHRYLPGPHRAVFNAKSLASSDETLITESIIDGLSFASAGFHNVISAYGVEGFTAMHLAALKRHQIKRALIAYDRDPAGDRAAAALAETLTAENIACYRVEFPKGMDANEYACRLRPAEKSLQIVVRNAVPMLGAPARISFPVSAVSARDPELAAQSVLEPSEPIESSMPIAPTKPPEPSKPLESPDRPELAPVTATSRPESHPLLAAPNAPMLPAPSGLDVEDRGHEMIISIADRRYRVRGLGKNNSLDSMRINLLCVRGEAYFLDSFDMGASRQREAFTRHAAADLGLDEATVKSDVGKILLKLEQLQNKRIEALLEPKNTKPEISPQDEAAARAFLMSPDLAQQIVRDFERAGVVGEADNLLLAYLAGVSRKLPDPIAVIVQSSSAAGETSLIDAVLAFIPDEEVEKFSAMTNQSLYYMGEDQLEHKILAIAEEEGAERASYALKLLQSDRELKIASTNKDPTTGLLATHPYKVRGPVAIFLTTTAIDVDEELLNRAFVLTVDEERSQTQAIHRLQRKRETIEGILFSRDKQAILNLHKNAQRILQPIIVANNYAEQLTFVDDRTRTRRDHMKYLSLIRAVALLRQLQKPIKTVETQLGEILDYIEVDLDDIELANRLTQRVLSQTLSELPPQTQRLLGHIEAFVATQATEKKISTSEVRFTRREIREATGLSNTRLKHHMQRLEDLELILLRGGRGYRFEYQLLSTPARGAAMLTSARTLGEAPKRSGVEAKWSGAEANMVRPNPAHGPGVASRGGSSFVESKFETSQGESETRPADLEKHVKAPSTALMPTR